MRWIMIVAVVTSMSFASGLQASPFSMPLPTRPPFEDIPPQPDVPPEGSPPFDLGFEIPVGPPSGVIMGPDFEVPVGRPVGVWMMTLPNTATGLDLDVPLGPPPNLPPVIAPPSDLDRPPFSEFPPDFEAPPFFDLLPPGFDVRPIYTATFAAVSGGVPVPEPTTGLLLGMGLIGLTCIMSKSRDTQV